MKPQKIYEDYNSDNYNEDIDKRVKKSYSYKCSNKQNKHWKKQIQMYKTSYSYRGESIDADI